MAVLSSVLAFLLRGILYVVVAPIAFCIVVGALREVWHANRSKIYGSSLLRRVSPKKKRSLATVPNASKQAKSKEGDTLSSVRLQDERIHSVAKKESGQSDVNQQADAFATDPTRNTNTNHGLLKGVTKIWEEVGSASSSVHRGSRGDSGSDDLNTTQLMSMQENLSLETVANHQEPKFVISSRKLILVSLLVPVGIGLAAYPFTINKQHQHLKKTKELLDNVVVWLENMVTDGMVEVEKVKDVGSVTGYWPNISLNLNVSMDDIDVSYSDLSHGLVVISMFILLMITLKLVERYNQNVQHSTSAESFIEPSSEETISETMSITSRVRYNSSFNNLRLIRNLSNEVSTDLANALIKAENSKIEQNKKIYDAFYVIREELLQMDTHSTENSNMIELLRDHLEEVIGKHADAD